MRIIGFFFENRLHYDFKMEIKFLQTAVFRLHVYIRTNETLIRSEFGNSLSNLGTPSAVTIYRMYLSTRLI
jgi:hypothetical protein